MASWSHQADVTIWKTHPTIFHRHKGASDAFWGFTGELVGVLPVSYCRTWRDGKIKMI